MTTKIYPDRYTVADIIADVIWTDEGELRGTVTEAAQALKDSGRLMPDLPGSDQFCEWGIDPLVVRIDTATNQVCLEDSDPYQGREIYMSPDEAREAALAMLAAADYVERNQA